MKKVLICLMLLGSAAVAQPPAAIGTGLSGTAYQSAVSAWLLYLYNNKPQGVSSSVDSEVVLFSGTGGKTIKRASLTGIPHMSAGVLGSATSTHVVSLFGGGVCSGYLKSDGSCTTPTIASGTASLGTSTISSGDCATVVTVSATGVQSTDVITYNPNASIKAVTGYTPGSGLSIRSYPTVDNVNFEVCNEGSESVTPSVITLNWKVLR